MKPSTGALRSKHLNMLNSDVMKSISFVQEGSLFFLLLFNYILI